jgi:prevent-host-death family protein
LPGGHLDLQREARQTGHLTPMGGVREEEALTVFCTVCTVKTMSKVLTKGAEEARNQLPDLLAAAQRGRRTIITRHGQPVAALVPMEALEMSDRQRSILPLAGTGRGLWGRDPRATLSRLRDEWDR